MDLIYVTLICLAVATVTLAGDPEHEYVITRYGRLRGKVKRVLGKELAIFSGIRFAKPPVGNLRFKPPIEPDSWTGTADALSLSRACMQPPDTTYPGFWGSEMWNPNTPQDEDCLFLNIWAPRGIQNATVLVWFFGGGFYYGSPSLDVYNADGLAAEGNVIVVNPNYRIGAFGFLYLGTDDVPGNAGLLDQQLAMIWIRENIHSFGGDPNKISLFGESAGAASVVAHMIAPRSKDLFRYGILQSGALQNPWAMDTPKRALNKSLSMVKALGCMAKSNSVIAECLLSVPAKDFANKLWSFTEDLFFMEFPLVIVSRDKNFFQNIDAFEAIRTKQFKTTNLIIGIMADEGTFWLAYYLSQYFKTDTKTKPRLSHEQFIDAVEKTLDREEDVFQKAATHFYGKNLRNCSYPRDFTAEKYANAINQLVGDYEFTCDALWIGDAITQNQGSVWLYFFNFLISSNPWPEWMGAMHGYEVEFVFGIPLVNITHTGGRGRYTQEELGMTKQIIRLWTNFAKDGVPSTDSNLKWPPMSMVSQPYLEIRSGKWELIYDIKRESCQFWNQVRNINHQLASSHGCYNTCNGQVGLITLVIITALISHITTTISN